jgi:plastocyanin
MRERRAIVVVVALVIPALVSAGLIPGGGPKRTDCYVEASVQGIDSPGPQVKSNRIVLCTDGDPCDTDGVCNDSCTLRVAVCVDQKDPNLTACTPPSSLQKLKLNAKLEPSRPASLSGSACGSFVDLTVPVRTKGGKKRPGMLALSANATAAKGTKPARDRDKYVLQCLPCAGAATTTTTLPTSTMPTVTVGPGGDLRFDPKTITIHAGDTVRWHWGSSGHSVVSGSGGTADGMFCSPSDQGCSNAALSSSGTNYEHTFTATGTFHYFCSVHQSFGMTGTVVVQP